MALKVHKFRDIVEMELVLRGGIIGAEGVAQGIVGLVGETLTFTTPAGAVTFADAGRANGALLLTDIKTQVEDDLGDSNIRVLTVGGRIAFVHPSGTSAIVLGSNDEKAKALLGFKKNAAVTGKVYGTAIDTPPAFVTFNSTTDNTYVVITNE